MPRHAAPAARTPYLLPAYYLTTETKGYPLVLLLDGGEDLPVAYGVTLDTDGGEDPCDGCGVPNVVARVEVGEGPPTPYCMACLVGGDHYGLVPTCYVDLVEYV